MAGGREIVTKIRSVENTMKVTSALEMVSASKIRKSQNLMKESRPYAHMMHRVIGHLGKANPEYRHPFTIKHPDVKKVGYIVVSSDRGLCGGLNNNLFKKMLSDIAEWQKKDVDVSLVTLGKKAMAYFKNIKIEVTAAASDLGEKPQIARTRSRTSGAPWPAGGPPPPHCSKSWRGRGRTEESNNRSPCFPWGHSDNRSA